MNSTYSLGHQNQLQVMSQVLLLAEQEVSPLRIGVAVFDLVGFRGWIPPPLAPENPFIVVAFLQYFGYPSEIGFTDFYQHFRTECLEGFASTVKNLGFVAIDIAFDEVDSVDSVSLNEGVEGYDLYLHRIGLPFSGFDEVGGATGFAAVESGGFLRDQKGRCCRP